MPEGVGYGPNIVAGAGLELNVVGDFAYAYGGLFTASTTQTTELSFQTGSYLLVGTFQLNGPVDDDAPASQSKAMAKLLFNGTPVSLIANSAGDQGPFSIQQNIIIPPYTLVEVEVVSNGNEADRYGSVTITGRIYK